MIKTSDQNVISNTFQINLIHNHISLRVVHINGWDLFVVVFDSRLDFDFIWIDFQCIFGENAVFHSKLNFSSLHIFISSKSLKKISEELKKKMAKSAEISQQIGNLQNHQKIPRNWSNWKKKVWKRERSIDWRQTDWHFGRN